MKRDVGTDVTVLVQNAGIVAGKPFLEGEDAYSQRTMEVNAMAHFWTIKVRGGWRLVVGLERVGLLVGRWTVTPGWRLTLLFFPIHANAHTQAFLPSMVEKNHGHVITIASTAGLVGVDGLADYCCSKAGAYTRARSAD